MKDKYNLECTSCGGVSTVTTGPLWWRAKKAEIDGRLDATGITGVECGCQKPVRNPEAPYRVFGFTDQGRQYDTPFYTFVEAVKAFRDRWNFGETVYIKGVSPAVEDRLKFG